MPTIFGSWVRNLPTTASSIRGVLPPGTEIPISCKVDGQTIDGTPRWYLLPPTLHEWVSARYVDTGGKEPEICGDGTVYHGKVIANPSLNVRNGPTTAAAKVASLARGAAVDIVCKLEGQVIDGNPRWYHLTNGRWVSARYVDNVGPAPAWCTE